MRISKTSQFFILLAFPPPSSPRPGGERFLMPYVWRLDLYPQVPPVLFGKDSDFAQAWEIGTLQRKGYHYGPER